LKQAINNFTSKPD
jgi:hypothetical protein